ncbi:hypothetical protein RCO48_26850 [Peribacillus frigoritolerans]|nr:hypothetical protein [Peribacillus frigoritolerans]
MYRILVADAIKPEGLGPLSEASNIHLIQKTVEEAANELEQIDAILVRSATKGFGRFNEPYAAVKNYSTRWCRC